MSANHSTVKSDVRVVYHILFSYLLYKIDGRNALSIRHSMHAETFSCLYSASTSTTGKKIKSFISLTHRSDTGSNAYTTPSHSLPHAWTQNYSTHLWVSCSWQNSAKRKVIRLTPVLRTGYCRTQSLLNCIPPGSHVSWFYSSIDVTI